MHELVVGRYQKLTVTREKLVFLIFSVPWVKQTLSTFIWTQVESTERAMAHSKALIKGVRSVCGDPSLVRPASQKSHVKAEPHDETPESLSFEHGFTRMRFSRAQMIGFQL